MKFCPNCGTQLQEGNDVCPGCGQPVEQPKSPEADANYKYCLHCGNKTLKQAVICPNCGCAFPDVKPIETRKVEDNNQTPGKAVTGLILGIIGLVCGFISYFVLGFLSFVGLGLCIPGFICSLSSRCSAGRKVPAIVISAIGMLISLIAVILYIIILSTPSTYYYYY